MTSVRFHRGHRLFCALERRQTYVNITRIHFSGWSGGCGALLGAASAAYYRYAARRHPARPALPESARRLDFVDFGRPPADGAHHHSHQGRSVARPLRPPSGWTPGGAAVLPACDLRACRVCPACAIPARRQPYRGRRYGRSPRGGFACGRCTAHGFVDGKPLGHGEKHSADDPRGRVLRRHLRYRAVHYLHRHRAGRQREGLGFSEYTGLGAARHSGRRGWGI